MSVQVGLVHFIALQSDGKVVDDAVASDQGLARGYHGIAYSLHCLVDFLVALIHALRHCVNLSDIFLCVLDRLVKLIVALVRKPNDGVDPL